MGERMFFQTDEVYWNGVIYADRHEHSEPRKKVSALTIWLQHEGYIHVQVTESEPIETKLLNIFYTVT